MEIPRLVQMPGKSTQDLITPREWDQCVSVWLLITELHMSRSEASLEDLVEDDSLALFLNTFVSLYPDVPYFSGPNVTKLRKNCFNLIKRLLTEVHYPPKILLGWLFLVDFSKLYSRHYDLHQIWTQLWSRQRGALDKTFTILQETFTKTFAMVKTGGLAPIISSLNHALKASPELAIFLFQGVDFVDALLTSFGRLDKLLQSRVCIMTYLCLVSFTKGDTPPVQQLMDHLYSMISLTKAQLSLDDGHELLLPAIVNRTPLMAVLRSCQVFTKSGRAKDLLDALNQFRTFTYRDLEEGLMERSKGKNKAHTAGRAAEVVTVERMSLVTQVQDLFPDLGTGYIIRLLNEYRDNVEDTISHIIEDDLPAYLQQANKSEDIDQLLSNGEASAIESETPFLSHTPHTPPRMPSSPLRKNVYDGDDIDNLNISASQMHVGKAETDLSASAPSKAAIYAALATFDSDDDERDDTYDIDDVGGPTAPDESDSADRLDNHEEALFLAYRATPEVFNRDSATRRGQFRASLKLETGLTDEAIEGWGLMVGRDARKLRGLEARYATFKGGQQELRSTAWRATPDGSGAEDSEGGHASDRGRGGRVRGRGGARGRGRGGASNATGTSGDQPTQVDRQRKEANKGSRANHNRRNQRAKKMARGGIAP